MKKMVTNLGQDIAIKHGEGPMMVLAGPGSGKTTVILHRVSNLINKYYVKPNEILVITFTKATATEMTKRYKRMNENVDYDENGSVTFCTFHSFFFKILRSYYRYSVDILLGNEERVLVVQSILRHFKIEEDEDLISNVLNEISLVKNEMYDISYYNSVNLSHDDFRKIYTYYEEYKESKNKIDFDDMINKCYFLLCENKEVLKRWQKRYKHILIDEFQDINKIQYESIKLIALKFNNLFIVGDDDQSIYRFRGARPEFLLSFKEDYKDTKESLLDINYRSSDEIIEVCNQVISKNQNRYHKVIKGTKKNGAKPVLGISSDINTEASNIAKKIIKLSKTTSFTEIAVIYRLNMQSRAFVDAFLDFGIPFELKDETSSIYSHKVAKDVFAYLNLSLNKNDNESICRIINKPKRYVSNVSLKNAKSNYESVLDGLLNSDILSYWQIKKIEELSFYLKAIAKRKPYDAIKYIRSGVCYDDYIKEYSEYRKTDPKAMNEILDEIQESAKNYETIEEYLKHVKLVEQTKQNHRKHEEGVVLSTMHSAKGLEFNTVFIAGAVEGIIPHERSKTDAEIEEERRLLYVGMTRAKEKLFISATKTRYDKEMEISRFIEDINFN